MLLFPPPTEVGRLAPHTACQARRPARVPPWTLARTLRESRSFLWGQALQGRLSARGAGLAPTLECACSAQCAQPLVGLVLG